VVHVVILKVNVMNIVVGIAVFMKVLVVEIHLTPLIDVAKPMTLK